VKAEAPAGLQKTRAGAILFHVYELAQFWDQYPHEPADAYQAFQWYRESGPSRTYAATARAFGHSCALVCAWARNYSWADRAEAYDRDVLSERDRTYAARAARQSETWAAEQAELFDLGTLFVRNELEQLLKRQAAGERIRPNELARVLEILIKARNLAAGKPTEIIDSGVDLSTMSETQRQALEAMRAELTEIANSKGKAQ